MKRLTLQAKLYELECVTNSRRPSEDINSLVEARELVNEFVHATTILKNTLSPHHSLLPQGEIDNHLYDPFYG